MTLRRWGDVHAGGESYARAGEGGGDFSKVTPSPARARARVQYITKIHSHKVKGYYLLVGKETCCSTMCFKRLTLRAVYKTRSYIYKLVTLITSMNGKNKFQNSSI